MLHHYVRWMPRLHAEEQLAELSMAKLAAASGRRSQRVVDQVVRKLRKQASPSVKAAPASAEKLAAAGIRTRKAVSDA